MASYTPAFFTKLEQSLDIASEGLGAAFTSTVESKNFAWPGPTDRRSGERAGLIRNIVDLGEFRDSLFIEVKSNLLARFVWQVDYAAIIFYGARLRSGTILPARDWIAETFKYVDPEDEMQRATRRVFT